MKRYEQDYQPEPIDALTEACTGTDPTAYSSFISDYIHNWDDVQYR